MFSLHIYGHIVFEKVRTQYPENIYELYLELLAWIP